MASARLYSSDPKHKLSLVRHLFWIIDRFSIYNILGPKLHNLLFRQVFCPGALSRHSAGQPGGSGEAHGPIFVHCGPSASWTRPQPSREAFSLAVCMYIRSNSPTFANVCMFLSQGAGWRVGRGRGERGARWTFAKHGTRQPSQPRGHLWVIDKSSWSWPPH